MARFIMLTPIAGVPPNRPFQKFGTGTSVADSVGNALVGDVVWPSLVATPQASQLAPLDAAAQALMPGSVITTLAQIASGKYAAIPPGAGAGADAGD
jgi:hypothetical protein